MFERTVLKTTVFLHQSSSSRADRGLETWLITANESSSHLSESELDVVFQRINENLHKKISLSDLADSVNMSPYHFVRLFKQATGVTPYQYLIQCRIEQSKRLLRQTDLAIAAIAQQVGFSSHDCFSKAFRKHTEMSPKAYRLQK